MRSPAPAILFAFTLAPWVVSARAEPQASAPKSQPADFFSGTVVSCSLTELKVNRKTMNRDIVTKVFILDENTKVEGTLKPKAHVTVRFVNQDAGVRAIHIIVR